MCRDGPSPVDKSHQVAHLSSSFLSCPRVRWCSPRERFFFPGRCRPQMPRNQYVEAEEGPDWIMLACPGPWYFTSLSYPMDRRGVPMGFGPSLYPPFGLRCDDTVTTRSLGRTHYPQRKLFPVSLPPHSFDPFPLEWHIRHHTPPNDRNNMSRCSSEHLGAGTVLRLRTRRCDNGLHRRK
ncbi:hypothetical protein H4582DRAFT_1953292 [Lactarius indigo]|nr:hypothetical protein H4582DRAFT_1953292 [Lactarius indigo]